MNINEEAIKKIAHLARLDFDEKGATEMAESMTRILDWVEKLNEVDTDGVKPLTNMSHEVNAFREDEVKDHLSREMALKNAPKKDDDYFRVPKVIE
ncbi:aspartyl/glutamyl-tRNA(Asn/Gln) amidotransferase subunit C [Fulvitalea axinellae]|uniref:Aspartyl/glutamyl-tRNA(Asn/Gln) amidotransferase subunit C n=1 Tax=Fulvitalea axinellae TaxID=1182444 RepID=A0AAU9CQ04_9BACT|nr:aspartyl/glutamyl-tRNA(Asn/Gln) amidotransferase subunit C [Fulvitalea axinellae]